MTEDLDLKVLSEVNDLILIGHTEAARLMRDLWSDRTKLVEALRLIHSWDLMHSEALTLGRALQIVERVLDDVGEDGGE